LEEYFDGPVGESLQARECIEEGENSWKEPCSFHRARRLLVRSINKTQGMGGWHMKECIGDIEGVYSWGGIGMWGRRVYGQ